MSHHLIRSHSTTRALTASLAAAAALSVGLAGCTSPAGDTQAGSAGEASLSIVATTTQLADFAREIAADDATVTGLLPPGGSAHHFDPSPKDLLALGTADVLIVNGAGLESFVESAVDASGFSGTVITAADGIDLDALAEAHDHDHDHDHGEHEHEHETEPEPEADHADTHGEHDHADHADHADTHSHDGHDHGAVNPHLWTSPRLAADMVAEIARGLEAADPERANDYAQRAAAYEARLAALDEWASEQFSRVPEASRVLVSSHDSLHYYLDDYGITFAGAIMPSFEDNAEPSAKDIDALVAEIKRLGVQAIFVESSMSPKLATTIAREAGVRVVGDDPSGAESVFADGLGAPGSGAETYIDATLHNTRLILDAWGYSADSVPDSIGAHS